MDGIFVTLATHAEQLGVIGILIIVIGGMSWAIRHLYKAEQNCNDARLKDAEERSEIKKELGTLSGKMEAMQLLHSQHLANLVTHNSQSNDNEQ